MKLTEPRAEQDIFNDLAQLCAMSGFVHALLWISFRDNYVAFNGAMDGDTLHASYAPERSIRTEFLTLLGLLVRHPIDLREPSPAEIQALLDRTKLLLNELHLRLAQPMWDALTEAAKCKKLPESGRLASPFTRADAIREPIFYGGESAYSFQYRDMVLDRYAADEVWLLANKAFSIADAQAIARAISELQNSKIKWALSRFKTKVPNSSLLLSCFTTTAEEIASYCAQPKETVLAVLAAFSITAPANHDFVSLGAFNIANARPVIALPDGSYLSLQTYVIFESLYDSPFYWMIDDRSYRAKTATHRALSQSSSLPNGCARCSEKIMSFAM